MPEPAVVSGPGARRGLFQRLLDVLERMGNVLPHPITLFALLGLVVLLASWLAVRAGWSVVHPADGATVSAVNLLTREGLRRMLTEAVKNFTGFAPLGTVLVSMLGIGLAEGTGLFSAALRAFVLGMPRTLLTATIVFAGINANQAADAGIVILPPLAAMLFAAAGRHPIAGLAAAYAGVTGGFSANLLPSSLDVLLAGFTQSAVDASKLLPGYTVQILGNWWFLLAATPLLTVVGTWVSEAIVEPRLGAWSSGTGPNTSTLDADERRGLRAAGVALLATLGVIGWLALSPHAPLREPQAHGLASAKPFFDSLVIVIAALFFLPGLAYGIAARRVRSDHDVAKFTGDAMATMGTYIVLAFVAAQFVNWFSWSNLGTLCAISGANALKALGFGGAPLLVAFVLLSATVNLLMPSASAKWAILAPVFVPMFALLGFSPEGTQAVFRVGDSCTNIVTPLLPYLPFVLTVAQRYDKQAGAGTILALMVPYALVFLVFWTLLLLAFFAFGWPLGPGVGLRLPA